MKRKMGLALAVCGTIAQFCCCGAVAENSERSIEQQRAELQAYLQEIGQLKLKYGARIRVPKVERVNGLYWRYAAVYGDGVCALSVSPSEFKNGDDKGGDLSGELVIPDKLGGKTVTELVPSLLHGKSVTSVVIPRGVTSCFGNENPFWSIESLEKIVVSDDHPAYLSRDGMLFDKSGKTLLYCPVGRDGKVVIPDGVAAIADSVFCGSSNVRSLSIPPSVCKIGNAFSFGCCENLRAVHIRDLAAWCRIEFAPPGIWFGNDVKASIGSNPLARACNLYMDGELVSDLIIPDGVTSISDMAFLGCACLRSVEIPGSVTNVGEYAFAYCASLERVKIHDGVASISSAVFRDSTSLTEIEIPDSVTRLGSVELRVFDPQRAGVFSGCSSLRRAVLPKGLDMISGGLFFGCTSLREVMIPNGVKIICEGAFHDCKALDEINIPFGVQSIGNIAGMPTLGSEGAFSGCERLREVEIPDSVTMIGPCTFAGCSWLEEVKMSPSAQLIGADVFKGCTELKFSDKSIPGFKMINGIVVKRTAPLGETLDLTGAKGIADDAIGDRLFDPISEEYNKIDPELAKLRHIIFPDGMKVVKLGIFANCGNVQELTIPSSVTEIRDGGILDGIKHCWKHFKTVDIRDLAAWSKIDFDVGRVVPCQHCRPGDPGVVAGSSNPLGLGAELRLDGKRVTGVVIPGTVERVGRGAYFGYRHLKSVVIEDGVKDIGDFAFYDCSNLVSLVVADSVTNIGDRAFAGCENLEHITVPDRLKKCLRSQLPQIDTPIVWIGNRRWSYTHDGTNATIAGVFPAKGDLIIPSEITRGDKTYPVTGIKYEAFQNCSNLTRVTIPKTVTNIGWRAFSGCNGLARNGLIIVGDVLFGYIGRGGRVKIPVGVKKIDSHAFANCESLTQVTIPDTVTTICQGAFEHCSRLKSATIGRSVREIGLSAFAQCGELSSLDIPDGATSIRERAFWMCTNLTSVTIPNTVTNIGRGAFWGCDGLCRDGLIIVGGVIFGCKRAGGVLTIPDGVTRIDGLWPACNGIESLRIPASVTSIDGFGGCDALKSIFVADDNPSYTVVSGMLLTKDKETLVVASRGLVGDVTIPDTVKRIGDYAFKGCSGLKNIVIPNKVWIIGHEAFANCRSLQDISIPSSVHLVKHGAFSGCSGLRSVTILGKLHGIGNDIFKDCNNLKKLAIPKGSFFGPKSLGIPNVKVEVIDDVGS